MREIKIKLAVIMADSDPPVSQRKLAEDTGVSRDTIGKLYHGRATRVDLATIARLCDYLGCGIEDILVLKQRS